MHVPLIWWEKISRICKGESTASRAFNVFNARRVGTASRGLSHLYHAHLL